MINFENSLLHQLISSRKTTNEDGRPTYWFDQPYHLYLEEKQAQTYLEMIHAEKFSKKLHEPAEKLIETYRKDILKEFPKCFEFYDLGPGLPTKTIPLIKELQESNRTFKYIPVDISKSFLEITEKEISKYGIASNPINCLFESLPDQLDYSLDTDRLFFIGLTFNNYRPDSILKLLRKMAGHKGVCLIITEYYTQDKIESILIPYKDIYAEKFNFLALELIGFSKDNVQYFTRFQNNRIEMGFELKEDQILGNQTIKQGTTIVTAISYRYTKNTLTNVIGKYFNHFTYYELETDTTISLVAFKLYPKRIQK